MAEHEEHDPGVYRIVAWPPDSEDAFFDRLMTLEEMDAAGLSAIAVRAREVESG